MKYIYTDVEKERLPPQEAEGERERERESVLYQLQVVERGAALLGDLLTLSRAAGSACRAAPRSRPRLTWRLRNLEDER